MRTLPIRSEARHASGAAKLFFALALCVTAAQGCSLLNRGHQTPTDFSVKVGAHSGRDDKSEADEARGERAKGEEDDAPADRAKMAGSLAARYTSEQAKSAALAVQPGKVTLVELEDENGVLVYSVHLTAAGGQKFTVKVDADTGKALKSEFDTDAEHGTGGKGRRESD